MSDTVVSVRNLVKVYGNLRAVDGISFHVERGQVFALLGPNGAGKTTTVEILETIRTPTSGEVKLFGLDIKKHSREIIRRIGVLPQEFSSFDRLTVQETLKYFYSLYGHGGDVRELLKLLQLEEEKNKLYMNLSGGLKRRVGVAVALVNDPELVFLDEPTTGLDPRARREIWNIIKRMKSEGKTVFLTTHYMEEAESLADRVAIISRGRIITEGTPDELINAHCSTLRIIVKGSGKELRGVAREMDLPVESVEDENTVIETQSFKQMLALLNRLDEKGIQYRGLEVRRGKLEEVFLALTGETLPPEE